LQRFVERPIEQFHKRRTRSRHDYCEKRGVSDVYKRQDPDFIVFP